MDITTTIVATDTVNLPVPLCKLFGDGDVAGQESNILSPLQHSVTNFGTVKSTFCCAVKSEHEDASSHGVLSVPIPKLAKCALPLSSLADMINWSHVPPFHPILESVYEWLPVYSDLCRQTPDLFWYTRLLPSLCI